VELRIPLTGGIKGRNELAAAKLRQREALLALKSAEVEIANSLDTAVRRVANTRQSITNYHKVVEFNERLLKTELSRLELGKTDIRKLLEVEEYLSEAKNSALENLIGFEKSLIEWQLIKGTLLQTKNFEFTKAQLKNRTSLILKGLAPQAQTYDRLQQEAKKEFEQKWPTTSRATFNAHPFIPVKTSP
jgi:outer membrane protein TolC